VTSTEEVRMALPVSIDEAVAQLQLGDNPSNLAEVDGFRLDAAAWVESYTGHILEARDVTERFRGFTSVQLGAWPVGADAVPGVAYTDASGEPVAIVGARLDVSRRPARVLPPSGSFYAFRDPRQLFTVTIRAGYEDPGNVPRDLRRAMLILISGYDADREGGDIFAKAEASARRLCDRHRLRRL
jgi:hypothetical protein